MPFYTYSVTPSGSAHRYNQRRSVKLAGGGLIFQAWRARGCPVGQWSASARELLEAAALPPERAIVIDSAPGRSTVSLFQVKHVLGFQYDGWSDGWSPICLCHEELFVDREVEGDKDQFKEDFIDDTCLRSPVRSFLYLREGIWGGSSRFSSALLWKDAWEFFRDWNAL
ncbi:hypothetical protein [uncultured Enterovirga sp.]|uniref:hypothetical protein n=1 Tax=uncultured Enterovirga sp. TaxID=2026352 RepID=UPI0035C9EA22